MNKDQINEACVLAAREMQQNLGKSLRNRSIWIEGIRRSAWPEGEGYTIPWDPNVFSPTTGSSMTGVTLRQYDLQQKLLASEKLDISTIKSARALAEKLAGIRENIRALALYVWRRRAVSEYTRLSRKVLSVAGYPASESEFEVKYPTRTLQPEILKRVHGDLKPQGATPHDIVDNEPRFLLVGDDHTPTFGGFVTHAETFPRRWKIEGNEWVEIMPYLEEKVEGGTRARVNPEYQDARVQDTPILLSDVMEIVVPRPAQWEGEFDPMDYTATINWLNILDSEHNPDGNHGHFRSLVQCGTKPVRPDLGVVIRHLR